MEPINFPGLNCYNNSLITIAKKMGVDYTRAFYNLWWENDFAYEQTRGAYSSKRLYENLARLGVQTKRQACGDAGEARAAIETIDEGEYFVVGMDPFFVPWNDIFNVRHGRHYFIMQRTSDCEYLCVDPTYRKSGMRMSGEEPLEHIFEVAAVKKTCAVGDAEATDGFYMIEAAINGVRYRLENAPYYAQADELLEYHRKIAGYVDALINNRLLFRRYIGTRSQAFNQDGTFMPDGYFMAWAAVKNGLYKAALNRERESLTPKISNLLAVLLDKERNYDRKLNFSV